MKANIITGVIMFSVLLSGCLDNSKSDKSEGKNATQLKTTKHDGVLACPSEDYLYRMNTILNEASKESGMYRAAKISGANQVYKCDSLTKGMRLEFIESAQKDNQPQAALVRLPNGWTAWLKSEDLQ